MTSHELQPYRYERFGVYVRRVGEIMPRWMGGKAMSAAEAHTIDNECSQVLLQEG